MRLVPEPARVQASLLEESLFTHETALRGRSENSHARFPVDDLGDTARLCTILRSGRRYESSVPHAARHSPSS